MDTEYNNKDLMQKRPYGSGPQAYREAKTGQLEFEFDGTGSPSEAAAKQVGGTHYVKHKIQPWDIIDEYGLDYYRGNAIKYILRNKMNTREDIQKAVHYLDKWLEDSE